jgi:hypothetical protein
LTLPILIHISSKDSSKNRHQIPALLSAEMSTKITLGQYKNLKKGSLQSSNPQTAFTPLSYKLLEDVMYLEEERRNEIIATTDINRIGPLVEYAYHDYDNFENKVAPVAVGDEVLSLVRVLQLNGIRSMANQTSLQPRKVEFMRGPQSEREFEDARWIAFCKRWENAGREAGLAKGFTAGLTRAIQEMVSNVYEHSEHSETSLVGYKWRPNEVEFIVADSGIGVLESLRSNPHYASLRDSGRALDVGLREGESRFGKDTGRGFGFRDLLYNIASRRCHLRFRSGDHCLTIDGTGQNVTKVIKQCPNLRGFLISIVGLSPQS